MQHLPKKGLKVLNCREASKGLKTKEKQVLSSSTVASSI